MFLSYRGLGWRILAMGAVLVVILVGGWWFFFVPKPFDTLAGTVMLTLALQGEKTVGLYELNVAEKKITKVSDEASIQMTGKVSPDGKKEAYVSASLDLNAQNYFPSDEYLQVQVMDRETGSVTSLTNTPMLRTRLGGWSPNGDRIVYTYSPVKDAVNTKPNLLEPNQWSVDVVDMKGEIRHIGSGTQPIWSPDGASVLYMKNDALYLYSLADNVSERVYAIPGADASSQMKLGLSSDGTKLAWSVPDLNKIHLFDVVSWYPFIIKPLSDSLSTLVRPGRIVFWPVWSPDGRYVVFKEGDYDVSQNNSKVRYQKLTVYDTKTEQYMVLADLGQYNFEVSFISDWR